MHALFREQRVTFANGAEVLFGAEIAMSLTEGVVDLCHKGTWRTINQGDPEADRIEMEPQEIGLRQQQYLKVVGNKTATTKLRAEPRGPLTVIAHTTVAMIPE